MIEYNILKDKSKAIKEIYSAIVEADIAGKKNFINDGAAFDTEVSSFRNQDREKVSLLYIWMLGIGNTIVYGRTLDDFKDCVEEVNDILFETGRKLIVYVHNFKYDFQFIKTCLNWDKVFAKSKRDILFADFGNIEFRDSLVLAGGRSLAYIGEHLRAQGFKKAVGDLNYSLVRTPDTPLTELEYYYCEMDIKVLVQYIREKIEDDGDITNIPYTNTGYVRRYVKEKCFSNRKRYTEMIDGLTMTPDCYATAERAFMGGAVGPNIKKIGQVIKDVTSFDIKSSYPYVMVAEYFPMSFGHPVPNKEAEKWLDSGDACCLFTIEFFGLAPAYGNDFCYPISESKLRQSLGVVSGSGRVITAIYAKLDCTELDYNTYKKFYSWDNSIITNMRVFSKGYLPKPIVSSIIDFFHGKTTLDGVEGKESEYMISKNMLNAIYGMMVEKPIRPDFVFTCDIMQKMEPDFVQKVVAYNNKWDRFLFYPWGIWVTAHARYRLYDAIAEVGSDFVYCDTDSVKFENEGKHAHYFEWVNMEAKQSIIEAAERYHIPLDRIMPKAPNGETKILGVWEREWKASRFKTIGPKRYLVETPKGLALTAAGTNKKGTLKYLKETFADPFEAFTENLVVPAEYAGRLVATFSEEEQVGWVKDYKGVPYFYRTPTGIHMEPSEYKFSIPENTLSALKILMGDAFEEDGELE